jgi:hypothetical protein
MTTSDLIKSLITDLNKQNKNISNHTTTTSLLFKFRDCIKHILDSNLQNHGSVLNDLETILSKLTPIDLTDKQSEGSSALYFEYSFFKLLKFILSTCFNNGINDLNGYTNTNLDNLVELMKYCLSKSIRQFELMQQNKKFYLLLSDNQFFKDLEEDKHDQINIIEL